MRDIDRRALLAAGAAAAAFSAASAAPGPRRRPSLTPAVTEGPYYLAGAPRRADIAQGVSGLPVELAFLVLDETGAPLQDADVDVWHCDTQGRYSGFTSLPGENVAGAAGGSHVLRGVQPVDPTGWARFRTIYPGWYPGRTTHVHYKVWRKGQPLLTSQVFLPDAQIEAQNSLAAHYRRPRAPDEVSREDFIARQGGEAALGAVMRGDGRLRVQFTAVVDRMRRASSLSAREHLAPPYRTLRL